MGQFIASWCSEGLESVIQIDEMSKADTWAALSGKGPENQVNRMINMLILRARFNPQRFYEIYFIEATEGISEDDLRQMFKDSPQTAADTIRQLGTKLYSDRSKGRVTIT